MHPILLHQIADDSVIHRRRSYPVMQHRGRRRRSGRGVTLRLRTGLGGALITAGTRLAGPRPGAVGLHRTPT